jgi:hypothetical protein
MRFTHPELRAIRNAALSIQAAGGNQWTHIGVSAGARNLASAFDAGFIEIGTPRRSPPAVPFALRRLVRSGISRGRAFATGKPGTYRNICGTPFFIPCGLL